MKKIYILITLVLLFGLVGCSEQPTAVDKLIEESSKVEEPKVEEPKVEEPKVEEPKAEEPKAEEPKAEEPKAEEPKAEEPKAEEPKAEEPKAEEPKFAKIDIDLSEFSTLVAYSELYNMLSSPDDYLGKIVKVKGNFTMFHDTNTDKYYFATIVADQTSCCQVGIEFVLAGDYSYPNDYPELGTEIEVTGEFQTYMEENMRYANLVNAKMEI